MKRLVVLTKDDDPVIEFIGLDPEFGYMISLESTLSLTELITHGLDTVAFLDTLVGDTVNTGSISA